ncbi:hypothetical protein D3C86_1833740 [compost metagenome]
MRRDLHTGAYQALDHDTLTRLQTLFDHPHAFDHLAQLDWPIFGFVTFADDQHIAAALIGAN